MSAAVLRTAIAPARPRTAATVVWVQLVDRYIEEQATSASVARSVRLIGELDPEWAEPWFFGILMVGPDAPERDPLLVEAAARHPDVRWFTEQAPR